MKKINEYELKKPERKKENRYRRNGEKPHEREKEMTKGKNERGRGPRSEKMLRVTREGREPARGEGLMLGGHGDVTVPPLGVIAVPRRWGGGEEEEGRGGREEREREC